jgi:TetR/AcrR family transcriptional regulator, transcriptional repressor for nem operon
LHTERLVCFIMNDTREYIIEQAFSLFLSRSYEAVSINDISQAIGLTKGALYHHFTNKEELFKAVIDKYLVLTEINVEGPEVTLKQLMAQTMTNATEVINGFFTNQPAFVPISYMALIIDAMRHYPGFAVEKEQWLTKEVVKIKFVFDQAIVRGEIRDDINTEIMATNYFSLALGVAASLFHNNSPEMALKSLKEQFEELYKLLKI